MYQRMHQLKCIILVLIFMLYAFWPTTTFAGIYESNVLWNKKQIYACFNDQPAQLEQTPFDILIKEYPFRIGQFTNEEKKWIVSFVGKNFSLEETEVTFVGWEDCSFVKDYDLILVKAEPQTIWSHVPFIGTAPIGQAGSETSDGRIHRSSFSKSYLALKRLDPKTIIHELGHVLGLRHEHIHPDTANDPQCSNRNTFKKERASPSPTAVAHTPYDPESIMSYCVTQDPKRLRPDGGKFLSDFDKQTLRYLYKMK